MTYKTAKAEKGMISQIKPFELMARAANWSQIGEKN